MTVLAVIYLLGACAIWFKTMNAKFECWPWDRAWIYCVHSERAFAYSVAFTAATWPISIPVIIIHSAIVTLKMRKLGARDE